MLTDQFLNLCCSCALTSRKEVQGDILISIQKILTLFDNTSAGDIPFDLKPKFDLTKTLVKLKLDGKTPQTIIDDIITSKKYKDFESFIKHTSEKVLTDEEVEDYCNHVRVKQKFTIITKEFNRLSSFVEDFESNAFDDLTTAVDKYDELISGLYIDLAEEKRKDQVTKTSSLDCMQDNFSDVLNQLELNNSGVNTVPTGYKELDRYMKKGFNPSRLYVFGGSSGDGKSTLLINCLKNAVENDSQDPEGKTNLYAYATLENLLDESLHRMYCAWRDRDPDKVIDNIKTEKAEIETFIKDKCKSHNANIIMEYFAPDSLTIFGLRHWIQSIKDKYKGKGRLRCVYVDYLDLLKSGKHYDLYRLELGQIALLLKAVSVIENIPIVTVTQLNREGYDKEVFSLVTMSESIKKVDHSDFVALLHNMDEDDPVGGYHKLEIFIGKNRSGPKNKKIVLLSKFSNFLIKDSAKGAGLTFDDGVKRTSISYTNDKDDMGGFL